MSFLCVRVGGRACVAVLALLPLDWSSPNLVSGHFFSRVVAWRGGGWRWISRLFWNRDRDPKFHFPQQMGKRGKGYEKVLPDCQASGRRGRERKKGGERNDCDFTNATWQLWGGEGESKNGLVDYPVSKGGEPQWRPGLVIPTNRFAYTMTRLASRFV